MKQKVKTYSGDQYFYNYDVHILRLKNNEFGIVLITVSWMLKAIHVASFPYLALKSSLTMTISIYYMI